MTAPKETHKIAIGRAIKYSPDGNVSEKMQPASTFMLVPLAGTQKVCRIMYTTAIPNSSCHACSSR